VGQGSIDRVAQRNSVTRCTACVSGKNELAVFSFVVAESETPGEEC
jgi:hypothetical protein